MGTSSKLSFLLVCLLLPLSALADGHMAAVVDSGCMDGTSGCIGACYFGDTDYVTSCVASLGYSAAPNFVSAVLTPNPVVIENSSCEDLGFSVELPGGSCPDGFYGSNNVCVFTNDPSGDWILNEMAPNFFEPENNPYVEFFEFPWGQYWMNDNPQCAEPVEPDAPEECPIAGRYQCPLEVCINGTQLVLDGTHPAQMLLLHDRDNGYFEMEVFDNPFGLTWNALMYQKSWEPLTIIGAMYNVSNFDSTYENPDYQMLEAHFDPNGCSQFHMLLSAYTSVPRDWISPYHLCDIVCNRIRGFGSPLGTGYD